MKQKLNSSSIQKKYQSQFKTKLLLAHSGGVDSCVLADILFKSNCHFSVAHANFQLRGSESMKAQNFVSNWCQSNKVPFYYTKFHVSTYQKHLKKGVQEATRDLRYRWFDYLLAINQFKYLLTAHHLNDQIETFLFHAIRGSGISGLRGIQETDQIIRPLLFYSKNQILDYAHECQIDFIEDSSNIDLSHQRNVIRHQVIAPLEKSKPKLTQQFSNTLKNMHQAHSFINTELNRIQKSVSILKDDNIYYSLSKLKNIKHLEFCLFHWFETYNFKVSEILKLMNAENGKHIQQSQFVLSKSQHYLILTTESVLHIDSERYTLQLNHHLKEGNMLHPVNLKWKTLNQFPNDVIDSNFALLDEEKLKGDITIGKMNTGDWFYPNGLNGRVSISKYFRNLSYNKIEKQNQWILYVNNRIAWIVGKRCDRRFIADHRTKNIILFEYIK
ncbi:MAG: tRNA lysidine(34) synthetase TilS [Flavobacteriaceae bacterium]|nr:tRNA lysidine(34) synthetase TilS [Flavobacteriaceae bacterium]